MSHFQVSSSYKGYFDFQASPYFEEMAEDTTNSEIFKLKCVAKANKICASSFIDIPAQQSIALVLERGDLLFFFTAKEEFHCVPWFEDPAKKIEATTFDPVHGAYLLVVCHDSSLCLVPTQTVSSINHIWHTSDITLLPPLCRVYDFCPSAVAWWERKFEDGHYQSIAVIGGTRGEIICANLLTGFVVGQTSVQGVVTNIQVCKDDTLPDFSPVHLLITNDSKIQWKLVLEDHHKGYFWPFSPEPDRSKSSASLASGGGVGSEESLSRPTSSFPSTRARLQSFMKQLSVEKFSNLRQKLSDTRNKSIKNVSIKRRGSSSSLESLSRHHSETESTVSPKLDRLGNSSLTIQMYNGKPALICYLATPNMVSVYGVGFNTIPISVYTLPTTASHHICMSDGLIYTSDLSRRQLAVVSCRLSQYHLDDTEIMHSDVNPDSLLQQFKFDDGEEIQALCRLTMLHKEATVQEGGSCEDQCAVVTNKAVYKVVMKVAARDVVLACANPFNLERAEKLCQIFGLDIMQSLEAAAEAKLAEGSLEKAVALYKLTKCRPVKSILHMAKAGFTQYLWPVTTGLLQSMQLSQTEYLHLANLTVLIFTEQTLRSDKVIAQFKMFLRENRCYDEVLAVSVLGQSGLFVLLEYLCDQRGLATQLLDMLSQIINRQHTPTLDCELCSGFWECMSNSSLSQVLVANPDLAALHMQYVQSRLAGCDQPVLERFANLYDPSQPSVRPVLKRLLLYTAGDRHNMENVESLLSDWLTSCLLVCLYLRYSHSKSAGSSFSPDLMGDTAPQPQQHTTVMSMNRVGISGTVINGGYTHVGVVRNSRLYTWGYTADGCLGVGPTLSQTLPPTSVSLFPKLGITVLSVSCGKLHTLTLTSNGVYAWGSSQYGQLGVGTTGYCAEPRLVERLYGQSVVSVVAGQYHSLALTADGRVYTWGWGVHGQLGHGNVEDCHYPQPIQSLFSESIVACSGGHAHSLMLGSNGRVWACGSSVFGQLGTGTNLKSNQPVQVFGLPERIISVATSYFHNLALAASNRLYTWGSSPQVLKLNAQGHKKVRVPHHQAAAPDVSEQSDVDKAKPHFKLASTSRIVTLNSEVAVSPSTEYKGLLTGRAVTHTTSNLSANNAPSAAALVAADDCLSHLSPTLVDTSYVYGRIIKISCGCHHSALVTDKGMIYTWGRNLDAQLGNGARTKEALYPTLVTFGNGVSDLVTVECGGDFTLAVEASGKVWGWGSNQVGQLGKEPVEDSAKAGLEGRLMMLNMSKRVIKLPHGSLNTVDTPKEISSVPTILIDFQSHHKEDHMKPLSQLSLIEHPPHGSRTLHYALSYFHGFYDSSKLRNKCVELGDYQAASKLALLDKEFDIAMSYQLQAALAGSETSNPGLTSSVTSSQPSVLERASKSVINTEVIVPTLEARVTVNSENAPSRKIGLSRTRKNVAEMDSPESETTEFETKQQNVPSDEVEEKSTSEIHTFAVQGGAEEMSTRSQDTLKSDLVESRCDTPDTLASSGCEEFVTKSSDIFDSPVKNGCIKSSKSDESEALAYKSIVNRHIRDLEEDSKGDVDSYVNNDLIEELVHIVEFYIDLCEQGTQTSLKALLKQGLRFWMDNKLPFCRLEALLLSHWSLVSYPLGLLLLKNDSEVCFDAQQVLGNLSTEFSLQLYSTMVNHVSVKDNDVPEVLELLSGLSWSDQTSASLTSEPLSLDQIISQISCQQPAQPYIDLTFSDELTSPGEVIAFSCGHKYDGNIALQKAAAGAARYMDDRSLPSTAQVLRGMYQQPLVVRHFACPTCVLDCVTQELG